MPLSVGHPLHEQDNKYFEKLFWQKILVLGHGSMKIAQLPNSLKSTLGQFAIHIIKSYFNVRVCGFLGFCLDLNQEKILFRLNFELYMGCGESIKDSVFGVRFSGFRFF